MKNITLIVLTILFAFSMTSCYTLEHTVGDGAQGSTVEKQKQWYALWGAVPINEVDSKEMAGGAEDYTIKSQHKFVDQLITFFTAYVSITVQTVEVKK